ncbi:TPA: hypothetical protein ACSTJZ_001384 [Serratia fonticola]
MALDAAAGMKVGVAIYNNRKIAFEIITRAFIRVKATDVVVTGASGAGKSYLMEYITSEIRRKKEVSPSVSARVEHTIIHLSDSWFPNKVSVIPGQAFSVRERAFIDLIGENRNIKGIMHVVDWGFTKPKTKDFHAYLSGKNVNTIDELRQYNLAEEINYLNALADVIESRGEPLDWFFVILNKIDLFDISEAMQYYLNDLSFNKALNRILGKVKFKISERNRIQPFCCVREDFDFNGHSKTSSIKNTSEQVDYFNALMKNIELNLSE